MAITKITKRELNQLRKKSRLLPARNTVKLTRLPKKAKVVAEKATDGRR